MSIDSSDNDDQSYSNNSNQISWCSKVVGERAIVIIVVCILVHHCCLYPCLHPHPALPLSLVSSSIIFIVVCCPHPCLLLSSSLSLHCLQLCHHPSPSIILVVFVWCCPHHQ